MNKIFVLSVLIFLIDTAFAQNQSQRIENFDNNTFNWEEFAEKKKSALIQEGYLILQNKKKDDVVKISTRFPMQVRKNFKISVKFLIPKLDNENRFGIILNRADEDNYSSFLVKENYFCFTNRDNGSSRIEKEGKIKLKDGKNKLVTIDIENKGGKLFFSVNGMTALEIKRELRYPDFGFYLEGDATIKIDEIIIEQVADEE